MKRDNIIEAAQKHSAAKKQVLAIADRYFTHVIERQLNRVTLKNLEEYAELFATPSSPETKSKKKTCEALLRAQIARLNILRRIR